MGGGDAASQVVLIQLSGYSEILFMSARWTPRVNCTAVSTRHRSGRWLFGLLPVLGLAVLLSACGGSSTSTASPTTSTTSTRPTTAGQSAASPGSAAFTKYTQCLTSHGVPANAGVFGRRGGGNTPPGSGSGGSGSGGSGSGGSAPSGTRPTIPAQYQKAFQACASLRPTGGAGGFGGFGGFGNSAQAAAYRNCLQIHGVTLPTPPTTTPGHAPTSESAGRGNGFAALRNSPAYQAAAKACASLLPSRTGGSTSTTMPAAA
jgi:hypothetical protein